MQAICATYYPDIEGIDKLQWGSEDSQLRGPVTLAHTAQKVTYSNRESEAAVHASSGNSCDVLSILSNDSDVIALHNIGYSPRYPCRSIDRS